MYQAFFVTRFFKTNVHFTYILYISWVVSQSLGRVFKICNFFLHGFDDILIL